MIIKRELYVVPNKKAMSQTEPSHKCEYNVMQRCDLHSLSMSIICWANMDCLSGTATVRDEMEDVIEGREGGRRRREGRLHVQYAPKKLVRRVEYY